MKSPWMQAVDHAWRVAKDKALAMQFMEPTRVFLATLRGVGGPELRWDISVRPINNARFVTHTEDVVVLRRADYADEQMRCRNGN